MLFFLACGAPIDAECEDEPQSGRARTEALKLLSNDLDFARCTLPDLNEMLEKFGDDFCEECAGDSGQIQANR